jgi:hypothetical protein
MDCRSVEDLGILAGDLTMARIVEVILHFCGGSMLMSGSEIPEVGEGLLP